VSIAELVAMELTREEGVAAAAIEYGYAVLYGGDRRMLPTPKILQQSRTNGRVSFLLAEYSDGSQLRFTWSASTGPEYTVIEMEKPSMALSD
jgi:hypothetical protein